MPKDRNNRIRGIQEKLNALGYRPPNNIRFAGKGMLNDNFLVNDSAGNFYVFRKPKPGFYAYVKRYLNGLYASMWQEPEFPFVRFRSIESQAAFMKKCSNLSIAVPQVFAHDRHWMLMEYIQGKTLRDSLIHFTDSAHIVGFLNGIHHAHSQNVILADRWGGNEIVTDTEKIVFLDFDIGMIFKNTIEFRCAATFDLAIALRTCLLWSHDKDTALAALNLWIDDLQQNDSTIYDFGSIRKFIRGACSFYLSMMAGDRFQPSVSVDILLETNYYLYRLTDSI